MSAFQPVGDSFAIAKFAYDLYSKGFVVARHAPEEFRVLLKEIDAIKNLLGHIQSQLKDGEEFDERTKKSLELCYLDLQRFKPLLNRYEKLAYSDRGLWPRRFQWASDQEALRKCKTDFVYHLQLLNNLQLIPVANRGEVVANTRALGREIDISIRSPTLPPDETSSVTDPQVTLEDQKDQTSKWAIPQLDIRRWLRDWRWLPTSSSSAQGLEAPSSLKNTVGSIIEYLDVQRETHNVTDTVEQEFVRASQTVDDRVSTSIGAEMDIESWIRLSTWWLLKSKAFRSALNSGIQYNDQPSEGTYYIAPDKHVSQAQADADLLKSSWIIEEIILGDRFSQVRIGDPTWRMLRNLSTSIHEELRDRRGTAQGSCLDKEEEILSQDLSFLETFVQPIEESKRIPGAFDTLRNLHRFLTPDIDYAGGEREKCLKQVFVNAQIGSKKVRMKSSGAPYLLLLWCQEGKSEIIISLFNQHNTVNLSRTLTLDDLKFNEENSLGWEGLHMEFPSQAAYIQFLTPKDQKAFYNFTYKYFSEIKDRNPQPGETLSFRESLESYEPRNLSSGMPMIGMGQARMSCEISLYDSIPDECWKLSRRLVISSSPAASNRWCVSHWLPNSRVQVQQDDRQVKLIWSDCDYLEQKSDGSHVFHWSYVYKPDHPKRVIDLVFEDCTTAEALVDCILDPFESPFRTPFVKRVAHFESSAASRKAIIYELSDLDETGSEGYHAVVSTKRKPLTNFVSNVFYIYRDFDFVLEDDDKTSAIFPQLRTPHYLSDRTEMMKRPSEDSERPKLQDITTVLHPATFYFNNALDRSEFMEHVTGGWRLILCHQTLAVHLKAHRSPFSKSHVHAIIQLWEKKAGNEPMRRVFAMRSNQVPGSRWTTCRLSDAQGFKEGIQSSKIDLTHLTLKQGAEIDSSNMEATSVAEPEAQTQTRKWRATIIFRDYDSRKKFIGLIQPVIQGWPTRNLALPGT